MQLVIVDSEFELHSLDFSAAPLFPLVVFCDWVSLGSVIDFFTEILLTQGL